ncbi:hypothetical protein ACFXNW_06525 [Nocardia sp. NPDC059180]|uniref:hypothetical protein n=1 Tax=Nocardia sp. NPDC059180 TaxID=3346761 RepID=UPI0036A1CB9F
MTSLLQKMSRVLQGNGQVRRIDREVPHDDTKAFAKDQVREWHILQLTEPSEPAKAAIDSGIAAVSRDSRHMDVFWVGDDGWVYVSSWAEGSPWKRAERVTDAGGAAKNAGIAALSRRRDHREVWWVAEADGSIQGAFWYEGATEWARFTVPGSKDASKKAGIAALSRRPDHMEVWWIDKSGWLWHSWFDDSRPTGKKWIEQPVKVPGANDASSTGDVAVVSRSENDIEVFWVAKNGTVRHSGFTETDQLGWDQTPAPVHNATGVSTTTGIAALSRSDDHMEVWWVDTSGSVKHSWWTKGEGWTQQPQLVPSATNASTNGDIAALSRSTTHMDVWWIDKSGSIQGSSWTRDGSWVEKPYLIPGSQGVSTTGGIAALSRSGDHMEVWWIGLQGSVQGAWSLDAALPAPPAQKVLDSSTREVLKGTLVTIKSDTPAIRERGAQGATGGLAKFAAINQFALNQGDTEAILARLTSTKSPMEGGSPPRLSDATYRLLSSFEQPSSSMLQPDIAAAAHAPGDELAAFAAALVELRTEQLRKVQERRTTEPGEMIGKSMLSLNSAIVAARALSGGVHPVGMLNLERIEVVPAGIQRGELVATIPLAPGEETAVTHKEWSVTSKEFTTIVTDELEEVSERGVTDNTDLAQSTSSQTNHANQFNITGTVQGGIPIISGSSTAGFGAQDSTSKSATESAKHAQTLTQKASSRSKLEHKTTISTKTETGTEETSTRLVKNLEKHAVRIDYFNMMREWRVRLYRYGLRQTYDVVIPEPGSAMRRSYAHLERLRAQQGPFEFKYSHSVLEEKGKVVGGEWQHDHAGTMLKAEWLADKYGTSVKPYPIPAIQKEHAVYEHDGSFHTYKHDFEVKPGSRVTEVRLFANITRTGGALSFEVVGAKQPAWTMSGGAINENNLLLESFGNPPGGKFLAGQTGKQSVAYFSLHAWRVQIELDIYTEVTEEAKHHWRNEAWTAVRDAAYQRYLEEQQDIATEIAALTEKLISVDTLTLRREENDEIMKNVLQFVLGREFNYMPKDVIDALNTVPNADPEHGAVFDTHALGLSEAHWELVTKHEDTIGFINRAIEWENVVSFLYSYFWDIPPSWGFIRQLRHPDPTRQAFLRAGAARVVLTVRKGWERRWTHFVETGEIKTDAEIADAPYLTIAQEIAAYDDRNYPGIPPANPGKSATRLQDAVFSTCSTKISQGATKVPVESTKGFVVGLPVILDAYDNRKAQETVRITAILNDKELGVDKTAKDHDGTQTPFAVLQQGDKGALIAEWNEYTPSSGIDIAITSNLATVY